MRLEKISEKVAKLMAGSEPEFGFLPIPIEELAVAYSWYAQNKDRNDADSYLKAYCDKLNIKVSFDQIHNQPTTTGFTARMIGRGANLSDTSLSWFYDKIEKMKNFVVPDDILEPITTSAIKPKTVQDYIAEQVSNVLGELDGLIDQLILSNFKTEITPDAILMERNLKGVHGLRIAEYYTKQRDEIRVALERTDEQVAEAYQAFFRPNLKKLENYLDRMVAAAMRLQATSSETRKPRAKKPKSPEKLTSKLKYGSGIPDLQIVSIQAKKIIDAACLWVYNTKTRKLGVYHAQDQRGLSLKGQTILNYSEERSICKKVRKPNLVIPELMQTRKTGLNKFLDSIYAVASPLSGRLNKDVVLLRVVEY